MTTLNYGPVDIYVVEFPGTEPNPQVLSAVLDLTKTGTVRLLDIVIASRHDDGSVTLVEVTEEDSQYVLGDMTLEVQGLVGEDDIAEAIAPIAPGSSVAIVALEMTWALQLAQTLANAHGTVVRSERIPAPVINQIIADAS
ncbi:DUF6325 family protein [Microbacterium sp. NC79]|uniref:DUF6325 family protein n=1 Tax=Microbacterium sp. NC79 TaxID=2851009 RepID=UPI001C2C4E8B|nr:DUF6325 family protein [Microbacterium sp. NC79]MBV0895435.1 hypothetical protein [Microbacterium sp. NC79]